MKVVISAGGKGTRIASIAKDIPKPMIKVDGKPVLEHELISIKNQGFSNIIITIGHLGHIIRDYFGDGKEWGISIRYFEEQEPLGTAGALYYLKDELTEDFLLLNGDSIMDIDFKRMIDFHRSKHADATLLTHPNSHPYDSALIIADPYSGRVKQWLHKEDKRTIYKNRVNAGVHILNPKILGSIKPGKTDLDREILKPLVQKGKVFAYDSPEYIKDMGTPERLQKVCEDLRQGKVQAKNLKNKQKAVFLDRDGIWNVRKGFPVSYEDMELIEGAAEALRIMNESGYLAIVFTNQPVIVRGDCSFEESERIHHMLETKLGKEHAYMDDIFEIKCQCREPQPELLQAAGKYNIDLSKSFMAVVSMRDVQAGIRAGCQSVYIGNEETDVMCEKYESLLSFVKAKIQ